MASRRRQSRQSRTGSREEARIQRALAHLSRTLSDRGLHQSAVREAIARAVLEHDGHFDVPQLMQELRRRNVKDAHLATVYRTLPLLVDAGLLRPTLLSAGDGRFYEVVFERPHHDHLVCTVCGRVIEFQLEAFEALQEELARRYGFELTAHFHELLGRCRECRREP